MAEFSISRLAAADLEDIYIYSALQFGEAQAERYTRELYARFEMLAEFPGMGLPTALAGAPCLKFPVGSHVIFYRRSTGGVFIGRILHGAQDPTRHSFP